MSLTRPRKAREKEIHMTRYRVIIVYMYFIFFSESPNKQGLSISQFIDCIFG